MKKKIILVTGCAGFIGYHITKKLLQSNYKVVGIDNLNNYYDVNLKKKRISLLRNKNFKFYKIDLLQNNKLKNIFTKFKFDIVVNMAAQAGIRYSIINPKEYLNSNVIGFFNLIENSIKFKVKNILYASSSSVYGGNIKLPYSEKSKTENPLQFYAVTKKFNELMAQSYHNLHNINFIGLRFFTVYGPYGRPDMALYKFAKKIYNNQVIDIYNNGNHSRDFTYIDDVSELVLKIIKKQLIKNSIVSHKIVNIGMGKTTKLLDFIKLIEKYLKIKSKKKFYPRQQGDMVSTKANISYAKKQYKYNPSIKPKYGVKKFIEWFLGYQR